jgi:molybdopterin-guanine dinucleotide biosynthesis protein B
MKIIGVAGTKNTGKTTLVTLIVSELVRRGYRVGTVKHTHHDLDLEGKDTWKHREAGSELVVGFGETTFFLIKNELKLDKILKIINSMKELDYLIIEGFKFANYPKISTDDVKDEFTITNINVFQIHEEDIPPLVDLLEERTYGIIPYGNCGECGFDNCLDMARAIIRGETSEKECKMKKIMEVELYIGDEPIHLNPFVQDFIKKSVLGMINSLKTHGKEPIQENVELIIRNGEN